MTGKGGNDSESKIVNLVEEEREEEEECKYELTFILLRLSYTVAYSLYTSSQLWNPIPVIQCNFPPFLEMT